MNDKALNIKIPSELYNKLKEEAQKKNISLASLVRIICSEYFDNKCKQDIESGLQTKTQYPIPDKKALI